MEDIQKKSFESKPYFYVFDSFKWDSYNSKDTDTKLSPVQENLFKFAEEFE